MTTTAGAHGHLRAIVPKPSVDTLILVSTIAPDRLPDRLVALEAVHNFRDLGGYTTIDGRVTRWQTLYRADGLHRLTTADVEALRALGLHTVVDLRTDRELDERGTFPVDAYPVTFHHLPVIDVTWDPNTGDESDPAEFLFHQYESLLAYGEPLFAKAFHLLGLPGALPAVFHCAAGKDRTGILAALILSALGVPHDVVTEDYGLSRSAMVRMREWASGPQPRAGCGLGQRALQPPRRGAGGDGSPAGRADRAPRLGAQLPDLPRRLERPAHPPRVVPPRRGRLARPGSRPIGLSRSAGTGWAARCRPLL